MKSKNIHSLVYTLNRKPFDPQELGKTTLLTMEDDKGRNFFHAACYDSRLDNLTHVVDYYRAENSVLLARAMQKTNIYGYNPLQFALMHESNPNIGPSCMVIAKCILGYFHRYPKNLRSLFLNRDGYGKSALEIALKHNSKYLLTIITTMAK